ncbi:hypothetical protein WAI453_004236 [Rhynchosporium graminicola]|uniref:Inclusion body clearance protein IML2 n=1 Tax=Rhynchosporium graminicola TaxID=2792576 RepID=A0A1E1JWM2_9HELO|nr:related to Mitochondrial outer membrane protein iml2 [Rhynchosporium commune]
MSRWFRAATKASTPMLAEEEDKHLLQVEQALLRLLNDDIVEADKILQQQNSSYHHLGRGISSFLSSMLAAEKELMKDAATVLQSAENKNWEDMKTAQKSPTAYQSSIYPPGTEYLLCYAVSQLTSAICAVLSGSVTGAMGGFFKLRKSFLTLDGIIDIESKYLQKQAVASPNEVVKASLPHGGDGESLHTTNTTDEEKAALAGPGIQALDRTQTAATTTSMPMLTRVESRLLDIDPASVGITSHTDTFIHSGTRLCYGILLLVFSMIDNSMFNRILYIVGFKGDRERGTRYLWQAARFNNFNSAIAGIVLLAYYNGLVGFCDILPTDANANDDLAMYPRGKCNDLLRDMRKRYPESKLWKMEEARMYSSNRDLGTAIKILADNSDSQMKQIALINTFELSLSAMYSQDYDMTARSWIQAAELSTWSPTLYAYLTGAAYIESYRNVRNSDHAAAKIFKEKATEFIRKAPTMAGKQKVMAQPLPFDLYIVRKVQKWEDRSKAWKADLVDVIGASPLTEMVYFWGGMKKQNDSQLQQSLNCLAWERTTYAEKFKEDLDEVAIQSVLKSALLRNLGRYGEARVILEDEVLGHDKTEFRGPGKDDWTCPSAHYEMAALAWVEKDVGGADHKAKVLDCQEWLTKTKNWPFEWVLDSRMSIKLQTSLLTVKRHRKIMGI